MRSRTAWWVFSLAYSFCSPASPKKGMIACRMRMGASGSWAAAVVASYRDLTVPGGTVLVGELGLGGQLRPVGQLELRLLEAARLGFTRAVVPRGSGLGATAAGLGLQLLEAGTVAEALVAALGENPAEDGG